ncbi:hypothetical protein [Leptospira harrisiae]|uniref:HAD family hydrolase n=1 Tax=Leptospira harrisiae TaxID=2023189 RepID=A0A2N0AQ38_9LEPT|nr:hypothetical protein [Leptospira harrisiae]PJZ86291.1 hypothetical protein CH364_09035 [Leptospira harrisiae]PKA09856.1 hypothetical protein CH366_09305 [Leptospira harrisiae]
MFDKLYVFDFDGVVCDSTDECMITSWNTWQRWNRRDLKRRSVAEFSFEEKSEFRKLRPRVRGAGEYFILNVILENKIKIENQEDYEIQLGLHKEDIPKFKKLFLAERQDFRKDHPKDWVLLHSVYQEVIDILREISVEKKLYIATLKDFLSIRMILDFYNVDLPDERIFDESKILNKFDALKQIMKISNFQKKDLVFFDDNVTHLYESYADGFNVYLTAWSNPIPEYLEEAIIKNIPIIKDFKQLDLIINKG